MIDNEDGRKSNVILQWVSREYLIQNKKDLKDIPVGPDEYFVLLEKGQVIQVATQQQVHAVPGLIRRFLDYVGPKKDIQLMIIDSRKHNITIPFEAYSSDRDLIRGKVDLFVQIRGDDALSAIRLLKEESPLGSVNSGDGYREFCLEDITELLRNNLQYTIDTDSIMFISSEDIHKNRVKICEELKFALNSKTPYWKNYGITVGYSTITIDDNAYEEAQRVARQKRLESLKRDADYAEAKGLSEHKIRLNELVNKERIALELDDYLSNVTLETAKRNKEKETLQQDKLTDMELQEQLDLKQIYIEQNITRQTIGFEMELKRIREDSELSDEERKIRIEEIQKRLDDAKNQRKKLAMEMTIYEAKNDSALKRILIDDKTYERVAERDLDRDDARFQQEQERSDVKFKQEVYQQDTRFEQDTEHSDTKFKHELSEQEKASEFFREMERKKQDSDFVIKSMEQRNQMKDRELQSQETIVQTQSYAEVEKAKYENDAEKAKYEERARSAEERINDIKQTHEQAHKEQMDVLGMMVEQTRVSQGQTVPPQQTVILKCPNCNTTIGKDSKFCPGCGYKLVVEEE